VRSDRPRCQADDRGDRLRGQDHPPAAGGRPEGRRVPLPKRRRFSGRRQPSCDGTSRMTRECHVRICERLGVKFPGPTRPSRAFGAMHQYSRSGMLSGPVMTCATSQSLAGSGGSAVSRLQCSHPLPMHDAKRGRCAHKRSLTSQPRSLPSMARLNIAKSRVRPSTWSLVRIDQTCFGRSGGFAPISLPLLSHERNTACSGLIAGRRNPRRSIRLMTTLERADVLGMLAPR
jgi:hypothetical protein